MQILAEKNKYCEFDIRKNHLYSIQMSRIESLRLPFSRIQTQDQTLFFGSNNEIKIIFKSVVQMQLELER